MKKRAPKNKQELRKIQDEYYNNIPESELNPNHKEDFEKLLRLAVKANPTTKKKGKSKK